MTPLPETATDTPSPEEAQTKRLYDALTARYDLQSVTRAEWRGFCRGAERPLMQKLLLGLAKEAQTASIAEQSALYRAAHATLPLRGAEHEQLVGLLLALPPVPLEWCDALVEALFADACAPPGRVADVLTALRVSLQAHLETGAGTATAKTESGETVAVSDTPSAPLGGARAAHIRLLARQIHAAGYHPDWLAAWERALWPPATFSP